jgi:hypothetical protein
MFVLIGDSITEYGFEAPHGWALQLSAKYARRADIINRGFGGACWWLQTSDSQLLVAALARLPRSCCLCCCSRHTHPPGDMHQQGSDHAAPLHTYTAWPVCTQQPVRSPLPDRLCVRLPCRRLLSCPRLQLPHGAVRA